METIILQELARTAGTPCIIIDHAVIEQQYQAFRTLLPIKPYYAVKANPEFEIVKTLLTLGAGFDVASFAEFNIVKKAFQGSKGDFKAFVKNRVIYANTVKAPASLKALKEFTIRMTFDNMAELDKIARFHGTHSPLVLRIEVPNDGALVELSSKFGAPLNECKALLNHARQLGMNVIGVSFHVGSQCTNNNNFIQAFMTTRRVFDAARECGFKPALLDIGGGFPAPYTNEVVPFQELAGIINHELDEHFGVNIETIAEPGRFLVATAATAISEVIGKSVRHGKPYYYIDDGVYNTFSGCIFDHVQYHFKAFKEGKVKMSIVAGPTCDALDTVSRESVLPDLDIGDLVYAENTGAYTNASATGFN
nr:type III PLP-dependent enzyme [Candidatus Sigynarchaeota archaeon]